MGSPMLRAKELWSGRDDNTHETGLAVESYANKDDGIFVSIKSNGWVEIDDDAEGETVGGTPEQIARLCQWFFGVTGEYNAGMGTTPGMWDMLSEILAEADEKLPESLNRAIVALRDGKAKVIEVR